MPDSLLRILNVLLLALLLLFFLRVLRAVWVQTKAPPLDAVARPVGQPGGPPRQSGPAAAATSAVRLRVLEPENAKGQIFEVGEEVTVGRSPGCGLSLPDSTVSQLHARLFHRDGRVYIEDLGSTNGTWVNRGRVSGPVPLRRGDRLQVGATVLEVAR
ncbi:MAG: hypothetical protein NVS3B12_09980 [Acidimicrobiales bacterium]